MPDAVTALPAKLPSARSFDEQAPSKKPLMALAPSGSQSLMLERRR